MKRARGLLAAEQSDGRRNRGNKGGGHRQARPDHQREQNEDHEQVGEPLEHVVRPGFGRTRPLEAQMFSDCGRERPPRKIGLAREQVFPQVPCEQAGDYVQQAGQYDDPGGLKVEIAAPAVLVRQHVPVAGGHQGPRGRDREFEQRRGQYVAGFAPIEARVRDHNFDSGDQQGKKAQRGDPVSDADEGRVARSNRRDWDGRGRTWDGSVQRHRHGFQARHF